MKTKVNIRKDKWESQHGRLRPQANDDIQIRTGLCSYNGLSKLEFQLRMTHLGQRSIMHILLMYKLIAKV